MEDRITYSEIRAWFLECYYKYCKVKLSHKSPWVEGESEVGYAYGELEDSFDMPIEKLMLEVLAIILCAGRAEKKVYEYHLCHLHNILENMDLVSILAELPSDEAIEFEGDLRILGVYS
ncbi:Imm2 family immunity protein [Xanthomonas sacchari]|uniref:Imm2 family immunity protein n=1 Tax=Xanthomonas sacchari TaxID=56458 RepID=UPI00225DF562|nr:Imm2 family immunity protein [Xanthomonas sacchari]MCW0436730.1 hypothetical protein [Xanthomonas sacchari]